MKKIIEKNNKEDDFTLVEDWQRSQNQSTLKKIISNHYRMVIDIVKKYESLGYDKHDLISEGILGLIFAAEKYDHHKGASFATYSYYWIRAKILNFINRFLKKESKKFTVINSETENLIESPNLSEEQVKLEDEHISIINIAIMSLSPIERFVIEERWLQEEKKTLKEVANFLGITIERVRQIEKKGFANLRKYITQHYGKVAGCLCIMLIMEMNEN
jgi:RNA polymerase sigma-32 factor